MSRATPILWFLTIGLMIMTTAATLDKYGVEALPLLVFLLVIVLIGAGGGDG